MLTTVVLSGDTKLAGSIELWVRQLMPDKARVESYPTLEAFKETFEKGEAKPGQPAPAKPEEPKVIKAIVVDIDLIKTKPAQWVTDLQAAIKQHGARFITAGVPRILMLAFDGGVHRPETLQVDVIDDLILKPLDKSLFMQKLEFLLSEDGKLASPTFLFRAKTAQTIEIGRDIVIDEISEFAISVRSPGPLPEGTFASIHADVFGAKGARRLIGRVYESVRHPVREGEYVVRFSYFGPSPDQLTAVRRFIKGNQTQVRAKSLAVGADSKSGKDKPGLSKELQEKMALLKMRKFAVVDLNPETLLEAKSALESSFKGIIVRPFPSFARLSADLRKLMPDAAIKAAPSAAPAPREGAVPMEHAFPAGKRLSVVLRGKSHELVRYEPALKKTDIVLGKGAFEWIEKPDQFAMAVEREDREAFDEFLAYVETGASGRVLFRMVDATGKTIFIEAAGALEKAGAADGSALMRVDLNELDIEQWNKAILGATPQAGKDPSAFRFEAILIDGAFLRPDPAVWHEKFVELLRQTKVLGPEDQPPKIFVLTDPKARVRMEDFRIKGIHDVSLKPMDRRYLMQKFQAFCPNLMPMREPETPPFVPCEIPAKLGREVIMDEVSEYGLTVQHGSAFKEKSFMKFFSRLFGDEGEWVSGRCHSSEKAAEGESYRCHFMFYGPADDLLQRIRRWIREDYVAKKDTKG